MSWHNGSVAHPQERYLTETIALSAALLLGRKRIFADYLTNGRRRVIVALFCAQQLLVIAVVSALSFPLAASGMPKIAEDCLLLAAFLPPTLVNLTVARIVVRRFNEARRDAVRWPTKPAPDGMYVYDVPLYEDALTNLRAYHRLGVARDWDSTFLARKAPRLSRSEFPDIQHAYHRLWIWDTQTVFEPRLLGTVGCLCFATFNLCWVYFLVASICLGRSEEATKHWFEWEGLRRFTEAEAEREAEAQRQREKEAAEAEARRREFVVQVVPRRSPSADWAVTRLAPELQHLLASDREPQDGADEAVRLSEDGPRPADEAPDHSGLFPA